MASIFQNGLFTEGFDGDPTAALVFTQISSGSCVASGVFGFGYYYNLTNTSGILLNANLASLLVGVHIYIGSLPSSSAILFEWYDVTAGAAQVTLRVTSTGALQFYLGSGTGTPIGSASAAGVIAANTWTFLEGLAVISATVGQVIAQVNGVNVITTAATQNTKSTANTFVNAFTFPAVSIGTQAYDNWYMLDMTGSAPFNTFLGPVQCRGEVATANSAVSGRNAFTGTPATGSNTYQNVAHVPAVPASDYNYDANPGDYDMFRFPNLPSNVATVLAVNHKVLVNLDSAGARTVALNKYSGGTDSLGTAFTPGSSVAYANKVDTVDPNTSAAWTVAAAQAAECGLKVVS
jgi:hypothetical protein